MDRLISNYLKSRIFFQQNKLGLAKWLFMRMTRYQESYSIISDVDEVFSSILERDGKFHAAIWYWYQ